MIDASITNSMYPFQKRAISKFNDIILKNKEIVEVKRVNDFYHIEFENGQVLKCRGLIVENSMIYEKPKIIKKKLF